MRRDVLSCSVRDNVDLALASMQAQRAEFTAGRPDFKQALSTDPAMAVTGVSSISAVKVVKANDLTGKILNKNS